MRRLFGVVMLAAVPLACGTVPSAPTASLPGEESASAETFAASARVAPCSEKADWASVKGAVVGEVARGRGSVTVRADLVTSGGATPCFTAVFSVKPSGRGVLLQPERGGRTATLRAPDGVYEIVAVVEGPQKPAFTASLMVGLPGK